MDHAPVHLTPKQQAAINAISAFNDRFTAFTCLLDPLQALAEAAHLKGRVLVFRQLTLLDDGEADEINALIELVLGALLDEHLTDRYDTAPIGAVVAAVRIHIRGL